MDSSDENLDEFVSELTRCQMDLFYFIRALTGDMHAAYDIRQAVNMVLWKKREKFRPCVSQKFRPSLCQFTLTSGTPCSTSRRANSTHCP